MNFCDCSHQPVTNAEFHDTLRRVSLLRLLGLGPGRKFALENEFARRLIEAQTLENRRAHLDGPALTFVRPLSELDFRNQLRLDPVCAARCLDFRCERALVSLQLL